MIEHMGVEIFTEHGAGRRLHAQGALRAEGYDAVFLGVGAPAGVGPGHARRPTPKASPTPCPSFAPTICAARCRSARMSWSSAAATRPSTRPAPPCGSAPRTVTVVYRRSREAMPAYEEEIEEAEHEGVKLRLLTAPVEVVLDGTPRGGHQVPAHAAGRVRPLRPPPARRGRRRLHHPGRPGPGGHRPDARSARRSPTACSLETRNQDFIYVNPVTGQTSEKWIFAGGDAVSGPSSVVEAVAAGERAAVGIDQYLTGRIHAFWRETHEVDTSFDPDAEPFDAPREKLNLIPVERRREQFRRSRAALVRIGRRPPGQPLPPLRLWQRVRRKLLPRQRQVRLKTIMIQLTDQQHSRRSARRNHDSGRGEAGGHPHPHALLRRGPAGDRRLPRLRRRSRRARNLVRLVLHAGRGRA